MLHERTKSDAAAIKDTNEGLELGDNCIQNFYLGRFIIGYMVGNLVLW